MKNLSRILTIIVISLVIAGIQSCEKKNPVINETGSLELFLSLGDSEFNLKSELPDTFPEDVSRYHALITLFGPDSMPVLEDELLPLYKFGDGFFSEKIELKAGHLILTKFMIINPEGEVIFASPLRGSPKAYLVKEPLPLGFRVQAGETTRLSPEVLPVQGDPPSEFGYTSFGFVVVKPLAFYMVAMLDDSRIMAPTLLTEAKLMVFHPDGWRHSFRLLPQINRLVIRGGAEYYKFIVEKEGYKPVEMEVPARRLLATSKEDPLIVRFSAVNHNVLRLQPDPDMGFDAMISNLEPEANFGKHPYFEATYMTDDSPLAVMRENWSLIQFSPTGLPKSAIIEKVNLTLFYEFLPPWDSIIYDSIYYINAARDVKYNAGVLEQIIEPWQEHEVTWDNQPKTNPKVSVEVYPYSTFAPASSITVDVTRMFLNEFSFPSYGMMFKLPPDPWSPGFRFASSDSENPKLRPMLTIHYSLPTL